MKELSIEEKAKAYDNLIERLKDFQFEYRFSPLSDTIEKYFPELKESEDEKIRKALIEAIRNNYTLTGYINHIPTKDILAWLEKQGEHANFRNEIQVGDKVTRNEDGILVNLSQLNRVAKKQDGQKPVAKYKVGDTVYYDSFGRLVSFVIANIVEDGTDNPMYEDKDGNSVFQNDIVELKPADKVEPKFNKGDILYEQKTMSILLVYERNGSWLMTFCDYWMLKEKFHVEFPYENYGFVREMSLVPATKEQCDLLFQKMKEAGYEWDAEKKELKKIVAPIFHIGDRVRYKGHACDGVITEITDTDYICGNARLPISTQDKLELVEQNSALQSQSQWKPSEEQMEGLECTIKTLKYQLNAGDNRLDSLYNDLKKLRGE